MRARRVASTPWPALAPSMATPGSSASSSLRAHRVLQQLPPPHRLALTLRYVDDLPVAKVAELLDRTVHATETLLVRARAAFRNAYLDEEDADA